MILKIGQTLLILLIGALVFISSGLVFGVNPTVKTLLQWLMIGLSLVGVFLTWRGRSLGAAGAVGGVLLAFGVMLLLNR